MAPRSFLLKFIFLCTSVVIVASITAKSNIHLVSASEICQMNGIHSIKDALDKHIVLKDCHKVTIRDSQFTDDLFKTIVCTSQKASLIEAINVGLIKISQNDFGCVNELQPNLQHLNVSRNKIRHLPSKVFYKIPKLASVDLSKNIISSIDDTAFSGTSTTLTSIDLSFNKIKQFKESYLMMLHLDMRTLQQGVDMTFTNSSEIHLLLMKLKNLNLQHNQLKQFNTSAMKIELLNLNDNQLETLFLLRQPTILLADNNNLTKFTVTDRLLQASLKNNQIAELEFTTKVKVESLLLSGNKLTNNSLNELKDVVTLKVLDLSSNILRNFEAGTFIKMSLLEKLNLAETTIGNLSPNLFAQQGNLKDLNISYNKLGSLHPENFAPLKHLETLDISGNDLDNLEGFAMEKTLKTIFLDDNAWPCKYYWALVAEFNKHGVTVKSEAAQSTITCSMTTEISPEKSSTSVPITTITEKPYAFIWLFTKAFILAFLFLACGVGIAYVMIKFGIIIIFLRFLQP